MYHKTKQKQTIAVGSTKRAVFNELVDDEDEHDEDDDELDAALDCSACVARCIPVSNVVFDLKSK